MRRMYEFDSVSVSSFEAGSLVDHLSAQSADGWDVVAIVPAGSNVVAYLRRDQPAADAARRRRRCRHVRGRRLGRLGVAR